MPTPRAPGADAPTPPPEGALRDEATVVLSGGALASDAELSVDEDVWSVVGDPTEGAFLVAEKKLGTHGHREGRFERIGEIPFTSERKTMSVLLTDTEHGTVITSKGAPDVLMEHCARVRVGATDTGLTDQARDRFTRRIADMSGRARRTWASSSAAHRS